MKKPSPTNTRISTFRSWARDISEGVQLKRDRRENVDLNGELSRAMERAYRQGFEDAQTDKNPLGRAVSRASSKEPLDPRDPAPLSRDEISDKIFGAFSAICRAKWSSREYWDGTENIAFFMQHNLNFDTEKQPLWDLVSKYGSDFSKNHAHRTIAQLVKLGLLQKVKSNRLDLRGRSLLALSLKGDATYAYISNRPEILETDPDIQKLVSSDPSP